jgi:UDPglucose--hexose-1-phosphate uridylyltransferase
MAPGRASRPQPSFTRPLLDDGENGPFAAGHESFTPQEVMAVRPDGGKANDSTWRVRVVPNLYPALRVEHSPNAVAEGPSDRLGGTGAHEVIIEDPDRHADLSTMEAGRLAEVLAAWRARLGDLRRDSRLACGVVFRHRGAAAGATMSHPHSQLLALPFVPPLLTQELHAVSTYRAAHGRCPLCDAIRHERATSSRMVADLPGAAVFTPFASMVPYELLIAPTDHGAPFEDASDDTLRKVAAALKEALSRLDRALGTPPYRLWLRAAPWRLPHDERAGFHWHLSVLPVIQQTGALEEAAGVNINTVLPEDAALVLRKI